MPRRTAVFIDIHYKRTRGEELVYANRHVQWPPLLIYSDCYENEYFFYKKINFHACWLRRTVDPHILYIIKQFAQSMHYAV